MNAQIRCCRMQHLIRVYTVCQSSSNILDISAGRRMDSCYFLDKYGKKQRCPNRVNEVCIYQLYTIFTQNKCTYASLYHSNSGFDCWLIVLGYNKMSTLVGHFVSSPRDREKRDRRDSRGDEREGLGRKREMKESEGTEEITFPLTCCKDSRPCPTVSQYQWGAPVTKATGHLCLTQPPSVFNHQRTLIVIRYLKLHTSQNCRRKLKEKQKIHK